MLSSEERILTLAELRPRLRAAARAGKKIVFTNGCFDLLHPGHLTYLEQARELGDLLVVAVNSDASVRRLKGEPRPILGQEVRARMLAGLRAVDYVTIFDDPDPERVIAALEPDILVKGGDWQPAAIVGRELVEARGGRVYSLPFVGSFSTSRLLAEIVRRCAAGPEAG
ncbi:MAG: D-glycero-beta-D-manno-heptose 1-phosphate adenylyltransferase [Deltaproteobacteria bacterium]|nr:D-glycero-beta-D-manno-heptose 1-phosphate adenylyltransferase [Deltaproteobacteria bacterium]